LKKKNKIYAIVPARGGSKGIKNKNLKKINNKSLIQITSEFIDKSNLFDGKIISSDSEKILNHAKKLNFDLIKRPKNLSGDRISDFEVIKHCLEKFEKKKLPDYIVYLQPTAPIRKIDHLRKTLNIVIKKKYNSSWSVTKIDKKFHPLKILQIKKDTLELYLSLGKKIIARQMLNSIFIRNGIFYIFKVKQLLKKKTIYLEKTYSSITYYQSVNIDTIKDLNRAKKIIKMKKNSINFN
jgi:CMP-N,N'-diacetyllegionaminic acid synthase